MKRSIFVLSLAVVTFSVLALNIHSASAGCDEESHSQHEEKGDQGKVSSNVEPTEFGASLSIKNPIRLSEALINSSKYTESDVLVSGKVTKVCREKGCWMVLKDSKESVRVSFLDYGFFVPPSLQDKNVIAQGRFKSTPKGPQFVASAVAVQQ